MPTSDPTASDPATEASTTEPARMDVRTTQQMLREMTTLTGALFDLLQPHPAAEPEATPEVAPISPAAPAAVIVPAVPPPSPTVSSVPLPDLPAVPEPSVAPRASATAPLASIPLPSLPVPDLPQEPEEADEEDQPAKGNGSSMALMNEIAFLDG
jgi:hypothetical protein